MLERLSCRSSVHGEHRSLVSPDSGATGRGQRELGRALHRHGSSWLLTRAYAEAAVIRAAFGVDDQPVLNRSYRELAWHYGFEIDPTPPRSPKKKGKVEYVKHNFLRAEQPTRPPRISRSWTACAIAHLRWT